MNISLLSNALRSASSSYGEKIGELTSKLLQNKVVRVVGIIFMALTALYLAYRYGNCCAKRLSVEGEGKPAPIHRQERLFEPLRYNSAELIGVLPVLNYSYEEGDRADMKTMNKIRAQMTAPVMKVCFCFSESSPKNYYYMIKIDRLEKEELFQEEGVKEELNGRDGLSRWQGSDHSTVEGAIESQGLLWLTYDSKDNLLRVFASPFGESIRLTSLDVRDLLSNGKFTIEKQEWVIPDYAEFRTTVQAIDGKNLPLSEPSAVIGEGDSID